MCLLGLSPMSIKNLVTFNKRPDFYCEIVFDNLRAYALDLKKRGK